MISFSEGLLAAIMSVRGNERIIINAFAAVFAKQNAVFLKKAYKERGGDALVAVHKAVILRHKIK